MFVLRSSTNKKYCKRYIACTETGKEYSINRDLYASYLNASQEDLGALWRLMDGKNGESKRQERRKLKRTKAVLKIALDTETAGFAGDVLCIQALASHPCIGEQKPIVIADDNSACVVPMFDQLNALVDDHQDNITAVHIYIHNAAFDLPRIMHALPGGKLEAVVSGSTHIMSTLVYKDKRYKIYDTIRMLPSSLDKLAKAFAPHLPKLQISHYEGFDPNNPEHIDYAERDVVTLMAVLEAYAALLGKPVEKLRPTVASEAFGVMSNMVQDDAGDHVQKPKGARKNVNLFFQNNAYTGGRVYIKEGIRLDQEYEVVSYDITSSYPYEMMRQAFPLGESPKVSRKRLPNNAGRYFVRIRVKGYNPDVPVLPYRVTDAETGLKESTHYPRGDFETILADVEYQYFLKNTGGASWDAIEYIYWDKSACQHYFAHFVKEWKRVKEDGDELNKVEKGSGDAKRSVGKLMLNSSYGKLAQKYALEEPLKFINDSGTVREATEEDLEEFGEARKGGKAQDHRMAYNAAFITAGARMNLLNPFLFFGVGAILYTDTDSVKILKDVHDRIIAEKGYPDFIDASGTGEFGKWKNEGEYTFVIVAPKVYMLKSVMENGEAEYELKCKGFPLRGIDELLIGEKIHKSPEIRCDNDADKWRDKCLALIYEGLLQGSLVQARYDSRPSAFKTAMASRKGIACNPFKSLYNPEKTGAYDYDADNHCYRVKSVNDDEGKDTFSYWCKFYEEKYPD